MCWDLGVCLLGLVFWGLRILEFGFERFWFGIVGLVGIRPYVGFRVYWVDWRAGLTPQPPPSV